MADRVLNAFRVHLALAIIVIGLGSWYLTFLCYGTPLNLNHDELNFLFDGLRLPAQQKLIGYGHGPLFYEVLAVVEMSIYATARLTGRVATSFDYLVNVLANLPMHLRVARAATALAAIATVIQLYRVAWLFGGRTAGTVAAALCATNYTFIAMSSIAKEDPFNWFFTLLAMELAWRATLTGSKRAAFGAGVAVGAATAAKYLGVFGGALVLVPLIRRQSRPLSQAVKLSLLIGVSAALSFVALFPFLLTDSTAVFTSIMGWEQALAGTSRRLTAPAYLFHHLPNLVGPVVLAIGAVEFMRQLLRDARGPVLLFVVAVVQFAFVASRSGYSMAHYVFVVALCLFVLAGSAASALASRIRMGHPIAAAAVIAIIAFDPAFGSSALKHALRVTAPDTRLIVRDHLIRVAREGDCVLISQAISNENTLGPPIGAIESGRSNRPFARAMAQANAKTPGPRFEVRLVRGTHVSAEAANGCDWIVAGRYARRLSAVETGGLEASVNDDPRVPPGFVLMAVVPSFPEQHSVWFPFPTTLDYEAVRKTPLRKLFRERRNGLTFFLYRNASAAATSSPAARHLR